MGHEGDPPPAWTSTLTRRLHHPDVPLSYASGFGPVDYNPSRNSSQGVAGIVSVME